MINNPEASRPEKLPSAADFFRRELRKPDGRGLTLYARTPIGENIEPTQPQVEAPKGEPHLRWHPLREEWVTYAAHRQNRTFFPPPEYNPFAVTASKEFPTELPVGDYDIAVFDNLFSSFKTNAQLAPTLGVDTRPAEGHCEVVVFSKDPAGSLTAMPLNQIRLLLDVWADRYEVISRNPKIQYILPFENRGVEVGVTLHHPHGQIYSYPFVPPVPRKMSESQERYFIKHGRTVLQDLIDGEKRDRARIIHEGASSISFIPICARYAYETWVAPLRPVASLGELSADERDDFARTLKITLAKFDGLWAQPFSYLMALYAAPVNGAAREGWHFHIEFYPPYRAKSRLKFLAGTEIGAGIFVNDTLPEEKAAELRAVEVPLV